MNIIERSLDNLLVRLTKYKKEAKERPFVLLFEGLTGSGKTSLVHKWIKDNEKNLQVNNFKHYWLSATNLKVNTINMNNKDYDIIFSSDEVDNLCKANIVIIDDLDWTLLKDRKHIIKFISSREVVDPKSITGKKFIDNILAFVLIAHPQECVGMGFKPLSQEDIDLISK